MKRTTAGNRRYRLPKDSILRGRTTFSELFESGESFRSGNLVFRYRILKHSNADLGPQVLVGFVVPKRHGKAVDRNRTRRLVKESWRLERPRFLEEVSSSLLLHLALVWSGQPAHVQPPLLSRVQTDLQNGLERLRKKLASDEKGERP